MKHLLFLNEEKKRKKKKMKKRILNPNSISKKIYIVPTIPGDLLSTHNQIIEL